MVVAYNDSGSALGGANQFTGFASSRTRAAASRTTERFPPSSLGDAGDSALARDNATGAFYLTTLAYNGPGVRFFKSTNGGQSFMPPVLATPGVPSSDTNRQAVGHGGQLRRTGSAHHLRLRGQHRHRPARRALPLDRPGRDVRPYRRHGRLLAPAGTAASSRSARITAFTSFTSVIGQQQVVRPPFHRPGGELRRRAPGCESRHHVRERRPGAQGRLPLQLRSAGSRQPRQR